MRISAFSIAILSLIAASSAYAEDAASHFSVLDAGHFSVEAELTGSKVNSSVIDRLSDNLLPNGSSAFSGTSRSYSSSLLANVYAGLGSGFEFSANLPYTIRNFSETSLNNGNDYVYNKDGFTDVTLGLKYNAFKSADGEDAILVKGTVLHHSNSVGTLHAEVDYIHVFSPSFKNAIEFSYDKRQGAQDSVNVINYLMYSLSPQLSVSPFIAISKQLSYEKSFSYSSYSGGAQLSYRPVPDWVITPAISFGHVNEINNNFSVNIAGPTHYVTGTLFVQKSF